MRRLVTAFTIGGAGLLVAAPASAQFYPQPSPYGYGYGYNSGFGQVQELQARVSNVFRSLGSVRPDQRYQIRAEAISLSRDLRMAAVNGLDPYELRNLNVRISRLERREQWASMNGWNRSNGYNSYGGYGYDRGDRHHRDDRDNDDEDD